MGNSYITIQEAAELADKSIQTIRRALKGKKLKFKRQDTPQGFNYLINRESLCSIYKIVIKGEKQAEVKEEAKESAPKVTATKSDKMMISAEDFNSFARTMESLISQHSEERRSFLHLVNTLQEKIFVLENQINLLKEPKAKWYQVWR